jgi:hypothetical protein
VVSSGHRFQSGGTGGDLVGHVIQTSRGLLKEVFYKEEDAERGQAIFSGFQTNAAEEFEHVRLTNHRRRVL